mmetsp:Transcript_28851/g.35097  ORF Transcript_28851/g.35097 Transcript_28851/m.35097 type:complete len:105 (+) Transcript_28851:104-418(+)
MKVFVAFVAIFLARIDNTLAFNSQTSLTHKTSVGQHSLIILNQETSSTTQEKSPYYFAKYVDSVATEVPSKNSAPESTKSDETVPPQETSEKEPKKYSFIKFRK